MNTEAITVRVGSAVAAAYRTASNGDRQRLDLWVDLQLGEYLKSTGTLEDAMADMAYEAAASGLTPQTSLEFLSGHIGTVEGSGESYSLGSLRDLFESSASATQKREN